MGGTVTTVGYDLSGGNVDGTAFINFSGAFKLSGTGTVETDAQLNGGSGSTVAQSGGAMHGSVAGLTTYTQSGGSFDGSLTTLTYDLTGGSASSSGGTIAAANEFLLEPASGSGHGGCRAFGRRQAGEVRRRYRRALGRQQLHRHGLDQGGHTASARRAALPTQARSVLPIQPARRFW